MRYIISLISFFVVVNSYGQTKKPDKKKSQIEWTWDGKKVTYSQFRDSMKVFYLRYCDSVSKSIKKS